MNSYPHDSITINGRKVSFQEIVERVAIGASDFERATFDFISDWINERETFPQKTSGSTGDPKIIAISRKQMIASAKLSINALELKEEYKALLCISPEYIGGKMLLVRCLVAGMQIIATTPTSNPLGSIGEDLLIDFAAMIPYQVHEIVNSPESRKLDQIKKIIVGGASLDKQTESRLQGYRCIFYSTYGMTETVSHVALRQLNGPQASDYYQTLPGIIISKDERNCLVIEWSQLPQKIVTNDLVEIVEKDVFRWLGRWDNIINTGGIKVIPEKLEELIGTIFKSLGIQNAFFVGGVSDPALGNKVTLFIQGDLEADVVEKVKGRIAQVMPKMEAPKQVLLLESFALTENGKINRKETAKPYTTAM